MLSDLTRDEWEILAELLKQRIHEIGPEARRSDAWHYKDMLQVERATLERLSEKLQALMQELEAPTAGT